MLPPRGNYTLIVFLAAPCHIKTPKQGWLSLDLGYYAYTGSALGRGSVSLPRRVARHLRKRKKRHWHIDYILANRQVRIVSVVANLSEESRECEVNKSIRNNIGGTIPIKGFGASDCKGNCKSHLTYLGQNANVEQIADVYKQVFSIGQPQIHRL